jgi:hypothetical protein
LNENYFGILDKLLITPSCTLTCNSDTFWKRVL